LSALMACSVHRVGLVEADAGRVRLVGADGRGERLVLLGDAAVLRGMEGHLVEVDGRKALGALQVEEFRALEGPHALPVWLGQVQRLGAQIGIADRASGELMLVDDRAAAELAPHVGEWIAAEAYVDGFLHVVVQHWVLLDR
jgi:hypothetical protein